MEPRGGTGIPVQQHITEALLYKGYAAWASGSLRKSGIRCLTFGGWEGSVVMGHGCSGGILATWSSDSITCCK